MFTVVIVIGDNKMQSIKRYELSTVIITANGSC